MELNMYYGFIWPMTKVVTWGFVLTDNCIPANSIHLYLSLIKLQMQLKLFLIASVQNASDQTAQIGIFLLSQIQMSLR